MTSQASIDAVTNATALVITRDPSEDALRIQRQGWAPDRYALVSGLFWAALDDDEWRASFAHFAVSCSTADNPRPHVVAGYTEPPDPRRGNAEERKESLSSPTRSSGRWERS